MQGVAFPNVRHQLAEIEVTGAILPDGNQPGDLRQGLGLRNPLQFPVHVDHAGIALLLVHRELGVGLVLASLDIGLQLGQRALGLLQHEDVLLGVDGVQNGVALNVQLRAPHIVAGLQEGHGILALLDPLVRF